MFSPLFLAHGSPMNAIRENAHSQFLQGLGASQELPDAIVVFSAHWQTRGTYITSHPTPNQIHDYFGFPAELRAVSYKPMGHPQLAQQLAQIIPSAQLDHQRGLDHGCWALLKWMFPKANIPVLQVSLNIDYSPTQFYELGKRLVNFSKKILWIGSGNLIHNLRDIDFSDSAEAFPWAVRMDQWFEEKIIHQQIQAILEYKTQLENWQRGIPTEEHLQPLFIVLGMISELGCPQTIFAEIQNGSISMRSISKA